MRSFIIFYCCLLFSFNSSAQCNIDDILPIDLGTSRFNSLRKMQLKGNSKLEENEFLRSNYWDNSDYLEGDSVYRSFLNFVITSPECFNNETTKMSLRFADDILYSISYFAEYDLNEFKECYESYKLISELLKPLYERYYENEIRIFTSGIITEESNGEEIRFYSGTSDSNNYRGTSLNYHFEHEYTYDINEQKLKMTGNYKMVMLELQIIDLTIVKLDTRGY